MPVAVYLLSVIALVAWLGLAEIGAWGLSAQLGAMQHLWAMVGGTALLAPAWWATRRWRLGPAAELGLLLLGALAVHLVLFGQPLEGTVDAYRYLWDGQVQDAGINPYRFAPRADELAALRAGPWYERVYRPWLPTCYPPVAQGWFWVGYRLQPAGLLGWKGVLLLHDLAAVPLLWWALRRAGRRGGDAVLLALSPLLAVQHMVGMHLDALYLPWLALALAVHRTRPGVAGAAVAIAALVRPLAIVALPALIWRRRWRDAALLAAGAAAAAALCTLPYAGAGGALLGSTLDYLAEWEFNGAAYRVIKVLAGGDPFTARWIGYAAMAGVAVVAWTRSSWRAETRFLVAAGGYYLLAPTVYPWYLALVLVPWIVVGGWTPLLLGGIVAISETVLLSHAKGGPWRVPPGFLALEWGLLAAAVTVDVVRAWRRRRAAGGEPDVG